MMNGVEFIDAFFACAKIGAVCVPLNWRLTADELSFILSDSGSSTLIFSSDFAEVVEELKARGSDGTKVTRWISVGERVAFAEDFDTLQQAASDAPLAVTMMTFFSSCTHQERPVFPKGLFTRTTPHCGAH